MSDLVLVFDLDDTLYPEREFALSGFRAAGRWAAAEPSAPEGCAIKGNVTSNGRIYHMPWSPWYAKVRIEPAKGERWFCSEAEAAGAGFRPAMAP
jgi:hypothetical protein